MNSGEPVRGVPRAGGHRDGFTLVEVTLALALIGLIAALALPRVLPQGSATVLRSKTFEVAALLRTDRNAALENRRPVATTIDLDARRIRSGASGTSVAIPDYLALRWPAGLGNAIHFYPDSTSSGGEVVLANRGSARAVRIEGHTAAIEIGDGP